MNEALEEWLDYCGGRIDRDSCNLLGLFKSGLSVEELDLAFAPFPHADQMKVRLMKVLGAGELGNYLYLQPQRRGSTEALGQAAKAWLVEQARFCLERGNSKLQGIVAGSRVVVQDRKSFQMPTSSDTPAGWMLSFVGDEVDYALGDVGPVIDGLMEALYGIAADYYLCWYVMMPMIPLSLNFDPYFSIWSQGARPVLTEDALVLLVETDGGQ